MGSYTVITFSEALPSDVPSLCIFRIQGGRIRGCWARPSTPLSRLLWQAQQERFAIDSHGEPTDSAKFRAALKALKDHREHV